MKRPKQPTRGELNRAVDDWNYENDVGCKVVVSLDNGQQKETTTTSEAVVLEGHSAVIMLEDISGCYRLDRVSPFPFERNYMKQKIREKIRQIIDKGGFTKPQEAVARILWAAYGKRLSQRDIARAEPWIGCHPEHEAHINAGKFETTTRMVRQVIRDLRIKHGIPVLSDTTGYFLPETQTECDVYLTGLKIKSIALADACILTYNAMHVATDSSDSLLSVNFQ